MENIYNLLRPEGGDCLLVFLASHIIFDVYKILSKSSKWSSYMKDVDQFISLFQYSNNAKLQYSFLLNEAAFSDIQVEVKNKVFVYKGLKTFKGKLDLLLFYFQFYYL